MRSIKKLVTAVAAVTALALPAGALAAPTSSNISTPSSPTFVQYDQDNPGTLHVTGTTSGGTGNVDLRCYMGSVSILAKSGVAVVGSSFSTDMALSDVYAHLNSGEHYCVLRAVPTGTAPAAAPNASSPWQGPQVGFGESFKYTIGGAGAPNPPGLLESYWISQPQQATYNDYDTINDCGLCDTYLQDPSTFELSNPIWWANSAVYGQIPNVSPSTRSAIQVDGIDAYGAHAAFTNGLAASAGFPGLSVDEQVDPSSGDMTIHETSAFATCSPQPALYPPTKTSCSSFAPALEVRRTIMQRKSGRQVTIVDQWSSADGKSHQLDAYYDDVIESENANIAGREAKFNLSWTGDGFKNYSAGTQLPVEGSRGHSLFVKTDGSTAAFGDGLNPMGALTYSQQPSELIMREPSGGPVSESDWQERYQRTVPASGHLTIANVYSAGLNLTDVQALAKEAETAVAAPAVTITAPDDGATVDAASAHVTGTVSSADGGPSVSVNGVQAQVAGDGSWSADVPLVDGANVLTAVAENKLGVASQVSRAVTRAAAQPAGSTTTTPPASTPTAAAPAKCHVPKLKGRTLRAAKLKLKKAHCRLGKVTRKANAHVRAGRVIKSKPGAGSVRKVGTRIALTLAKRS